MSGNKKREGSQSTVQKAKLQTAINQCKILPLDRLAKSRNQSLLIRETEENIGTAKFG